MNRKSWNSGRPGGRIRSKRKGGSRRGAGGQQGGCGSGLVGGGVRAVKVGHMHACVRAGVCRGWHAVHAKPIRTRLALHTRGCSRQRRGWWWCGGQAAAYRASLATNSACAHGHRRTQACKRTCTHCSRPPSPHPPHHERGLGVDPVAVHVEGAVQHDGHHRDSPLRIHAVHGTQQQQQQQQRRAGQSGEASAALLLKGSTALRRGCRWRCARVAVALGSQEGAPGMHGGAAACRSGSAARQACPSG